MTRQEQLLKSYILSEVYNIEKNNYNLFLERKELLEEGKIWNWVKEQPSKIKEWFSNKKAVEACHKELQNPKNSKYLKKVYEKLGLKFKNQAMIRQVSSVFILYIISGLLISNMTPNEQENLIKRNNIDNIFNNSTNNIEEDTVGEDIKNIIRRHGMSNSNTGITPEYEYDNNSNEKKEELINRYESIVKSIFDNTRVSVKELGDLTQEETNIYREVLNKTHDNIQAYHAVKDYRKQQELKQNMSSIFNDEDYSDYETPFLHDDSVTHIINYSLDQSTNPSENLIPVVDNLNIAINDLSKKLNNSDSDEQEDMQYQLEELNKLQSSLTSYIAIDEIIREELSEGEDFKYLKNLFMSLDSTQDNEILQELITQLTQNVDNEE